MSRVAIRKLLRLPQVQGNLELPKPHQFNEESMSGVHSGRASL